MDDLSFLCYGRLRSYRRFGALHDMAPSSSGPGYLVLIQKIAGSNPAGVTTKKAHPKDGLFSWPRCEFEPVARRAGSFMSFARRYLHRAQSEMLSYRRGYWLKTPIWY